MPVGIQGFASLGPQSPWVQGLGFRIGAAIALAVQEVGTKEVELAALGARRVGLQYLHVPGVGFDSQGLGCRIEG